ncbi:hypothetical protein GCM10027040_17170 [Halomonas shantousis]
MNILYLLIPLSLVLLGLAVWTFFWAVKSGQFDDLEGPAHRILFEDENDLTPEQRRRRAAQTRTDASDHADSADDRATTAPAKDQDAHETERH